MSSPLQLLYLRDTTFVCGPGKTILNTFRTLDTSRYALTLGVPGDEGEPNSFVDRARDLGVPVVRLPSGGRFGVGGVRRLARILRERRIDIVQSHDFLTRRLALPAAVLARTRHVTSVHGWITNSRKQELARRLDQMLIRRARHAIVVSGRLKQQVIADAGMPAERVTLLRNALLLDDYPEAGGAAEVEARRKLGVPPDAPVVSIVGRLNPEKGHQLFLQMAHRIAASLPEARFLIVGQGPLRSQLEGQTDLLGLRDRVQFLGHRSDMHVVYGATTVLALPSFTEGLPNVVLEAFAHGRPAVATRVGGVPEVVTHGVDGIIIEPGQVDALTAAVLSLLRHPEQASSMGARGRETVATRFDFRRRTRALQSLYDAVVAGQPVAAGGSEQSGLIDG
jgi:glycosyltransferase involved in cell wall biosynthesis